MNVKGLLFGAVTVLVVMAITYRVEPLRKIVVGA